MVAEDPKSLAWTLAIMLILVIVAVVAVGMVLSPTGSDPDNTISIYNRSFNDIGYWLYIDGVEVQNGIIGNHNTTLILYDYPGENAIITLVASGYDYYQVFERFYYSGFGNGVPDTTYFVVG